MLSFLPFFTQGGIWSLESSFFFVVGCSGVEGLVFTLSFHDSWTLSKNSGGESLDKRLIYKGQMLDSLLLFLMPRRNKLQGF